MSKVQTAAEIADFICKKHVSFHRWDKATKEIKDALEEWAKQLQLQPDESDEDVARAIYAIVGPDIAPENLLKSAANKIARHTAANVAEASENTNVWRKKMSKVQTAANVAEKLRQVSNRVYSSTITYQEWLEKSVAILEEWAKQLQPHPDESDESAAREIRSLCFIDRDRGRGDEERYWATIDEKLVASIIARHTTAKVAQAEKRGWNRGAEAMKTIAGTAAHDCGLYSDSYLDEDTRPDSVHYHNNGVWKARDTIRSLPLPPYQKKGE